MVEFENRLGRIGKTPPYQARPCCCARLSTEELGVILKCTIGFIHTSLKPTVGTSNGKELGLISVDKIQALVLLRNIEE